MGDKAGDRVGDKTGRRDKGRQGDQARDGRGPRFWSSGCATQ